MSGPPPDQETGNIKVVVRVRAFVKREIDKGSECLIRMDPKTQTTTLLVPNTDDHPPSRKVYEEKSFTFDKSFWSHDTNDDHYATQDEVYQSFGEEFLDHNFDGFHTCIFAYGQTGSGKSYTIMGSPDNPGLIPRTCHALFDQIENKPEPNTTYSVHVSYFEVYNEHVRDLLVPRTSTPANLKVRESQTDGVYVQGLTDVAIKSYEDVLRLMRIGDMNRTVASTKMNDTSSRSHAVFTIVLKQIQHSLETDETIERCARMRLVDLAGSERAKATEATGQRLVEGGKINKSLTTLGRVISALADPRRQGTVGRRGFKDIVPYRDSILTWLLKDSLGGNSKTAMLACISPTDYEETLSTLRYADQAKQIQTRATANIDAVSSAERDAQIATMAETIRKLQTTINSTRVRREQEEAAELEDYQKQVEKMQRLMEETRTVSEAKIKSLSAEVEDLRQSNGRLSDESASLRRHLQLVLGELRNPIVLPPEFSTSRDFDGLDQMDSPETVQESLFSEENNDASSLFPIDDPETNVWVSEVQEMAGHFLSDLGAFRRKLGDDRSRFGPREDIENVRKLV